MQEDQEEDEAYVLVELTGVIDSEVMNLAGKACSILGVETAEPVLKLGSYVFTGEYSDAIGTCVLFEDLGPAAEPPTPRSSSAAASFNKHPPRVLKFFGKTEKRLDMKTSFLQEKAPCGPRDDSAADPDPSRGQGSSS
ncbi:unnamed protein product [Ixodes hexagonus]